MVNRYWDSGCFIALFNKEEGRYHNCVSVLKAAQRGELVIVTSAMTLAEVVKVKGKNLTLSQERMISNFFEHDWIVVCDVDRFIAEDARDLIWEHRLQAVDAIHLATAVKHKLLYLDTYDRADLMRLSGTVGTVPIEIANPPKMPYQESLPSIEPVDNSKVRAFRVSRRGKKG